MQMGLSDSSKHEAKRAATSAKRGFTLIELLIAVAIVGVLSTLALVGYRKVIARARLGEATSMVAAIAHNMGQIVDGKSTTHEATWNAFCLADFGDGGVAFVAQPQIPPRNVNWSASGKWVHLAKEGFEKYFLGKIKRGESEPFYEKLALDIMGLRKIKG